jgi:hypothetical protein
MKELILNFFELLMELYIDNKIDIQTYNLLINNFGKIKENIDNN